MGLLSFRNCSQKIIVMELHLENRSRNGLTPVLKSEIDKEQYVLQLKNDHRYLLEKVIPEIEAHFISLMNASTLEHSLVMIVAWKWFADFSEKLRHHFEMEDRLVFPYLLGKGTPAANESAISFIQNHSSFEEQLNEYILVIQKNLRSFEQDMAYRILLRKLQSLENDLLAHGAAEAILMDC